MMTGRDNGYNWKIHLKQGYPAYAELRKGGNRNPMCLYAGLWNDGKMTLYKRRRKNGYNLWGQWKGWCTLWGQCGDHCNNTSGGTDGKVREAIW